jgi:hypothetical protein
MGSIAIVFLGAWLLSTVIVLIPQAREAIRAWDLLQLIPEWRFFAPRPGRNDYFLLYRCHDADRKPTPWKEVSLSRDRGFHNVIWNPCRRERKAWLDMVSELLDVYKGQPNAGAQASVPYIAILRAVSREAKASHPGHSVQFLIVSRDGLAGAIEMAPVLMSSVHSL